MNKKIEKLSIASVDARTLSGAANAAAAAYNAAYNAACEALGAVEALAVGDVVAVGKAAGTAYDSLAAEAALGDAEAIPDAWTAIGSGEGGVAIAAALGDSEAAAAAAIEFAHAGVDLACTTIGSALAAANRAALDAANTAATADTAYLRAITDERESFVAAAESK